jgi:Protein of unknown function (DUF1571)
MPRAIPPALLLLSVTGCLSSPLGSRYLADGSRPGSQPPYQSVPQQPAASNLRIPADVVAGQAGQVPLVPVPPVPVGNSSTIPPTSRPATQQAIVPAGGMTPAPSPPPVSGSSVRQLVQQAAASYAGIDSYIARLTRRELVNGKYDEEVMLFKFRKEPWSVYFKWLGETGKGREVIFVKGQHGSQIHTLLAAGDHPLKPAGARMALPPDSVFVRMASRHPITEAGIGASIERLLVLVDALDRGDTRRGTVVDLGPQQRPDFIGTLTVIEHTLPPGFDPTLPRGGKRYYGFDAQTHLPLLVSARDDKGQEVEYYRYDRLQYPVRLDSDDFDPDKLWGRTGGARTAKP